MKNGLNRMLCLLSKEFWLYLGTSIGISFFILIFKPFPIDDMDFDNRKTFISGLGAIVFLNIFLLRTVIRSLKEDHISGYQEFSYLNLINVLIIWILNIITFIIYLKFAGQLLISYYLFFKLTLIGLAPPLILAFYDKFQDLKHQIEALHIVAIIKQKKLDSYEKEHQNQSIEFVSENKHDVIRLLTIDIQFVKSSDNYVEINYIEEGKLKKRLVRNTLRNVELQLKPFGNFVRCHRNCIVNICHVENISTYCKNHTLTIKDNNENLPVSRQYLLKIKEAI